MAALEQWGVPLAVMGMLLATLFMAAVAKRYQAHQALVSAQVRRLELAVTEIEEGLTALQGVSLSRELRLTLRSEVLTRYQRIARLTRRYPSIAQKVREAEAALNAEGGTPGTGVGPMPDQQAFLCVQRALDSLVDVVAHGDTLRPIPRDVRQIFCRELGERRAEANARFHLVQASALQKDGDTVRARAHLTTLLQVLKRRGPSTDFVRELYVEAEHAFDALTAPAAMADAGQETVEQDSRMAGAVG